jgi:FkbM family methyltransferase
MRDLIFRALRRISGIDLREWFFTKLDVPVSMATQGRYTHERKVVQLLLSLKGDIFVDVGAHIGYYPLLLRHNFTSILAIEPHPQTYQQLGRNIAMEGAENIRAIRVAVSDKVQEGVPLFLGEYSWLHSFEKQQPGAAYVLVDTTTLSKLISKFPRVDLVKIDVEGAEWEVLEGAKSAISKIERWLVELHDIQRKEELEGWLRNHGYTTRWVDELHIFAWRE